MTKISISLFEEGLYIESIPSSLVRNPGFREAELEIINLIEYWFKERNIEPEPKKSGPALSQATRYVLKEPEDIFFFKLRWL